MPDGTIKIRDFNSRLFLSGGRDQIPAGALRRCVGAAPELTGSVMSRFGSQQLYPIDSVSLYSFAGARFQYDGVKLYRNGAEIASGFNGDRLAFVVGPPQIGDPTYLFAIGGGKAIKVDQAGAVSNWGIFPAADGMVAKNGGQKALVIDAFGTDAADWLPVAGNFWQNSDSTAENGTGGLRIDFAGPSPLFAQLNTTIPPPPLDLSVFGDGTPSIETDLLSFSIFQGGIAAVMGGIYLQFDLSASADFTTDYFTALVSLNPAILQLAAPGVIVTPFGTGTIPPEFRALAVDISVPPAFNSFVTVNIPKSVFHRIGTNGASWEAVTAIRFLQGGMSLLPSNYGNASGSTTNFGSFIALQNLQMLGAYPLGIPPGIGDYRYHVVFLNTVTGSRSNPNPSEIRVTGIQNSAVSLEQIPTSPDAQVDAREIYRTTDGGAIFQRAATIYNNSDSTFLDTVADDPTIQFVKTAWTPFIAYALDFLVDGGNGFYFKVTVAGTSGAALPGWGVPSTTWAPIGRFNSPDTIVPLLHNPGHIAYAVAGAGGISGRVQPDWSTAQVFGNFITDNGVTWEAIGPLTTVDATVTWEFVAINAQPALDAAATLQFDNTPPSTTFGDVAEMVHHGAVFWTRDSAQGCGGRLYFSVLGRIESVGGFIDITAGNDPAQKVICWDQQLYVLTDLTIYRVDGDPPLVTSEHIRGSLGTAAPFTVKSTEFGIIYQAVDGIRLFNMTNAVLIGFNALAPILRGQQVENVAPFTAVIADICRDEVIFSNGVVSFALSIAPGGVAWRMLGVGLKAVFFENDTGQIVASFGGNTSLYETPGVFTDNGAAIPIEWQTPSVLMDAGAITMTKRVWLDVNCAGEILYPTLLVDNTEIVMPAITNAVRGMIPIPFQRSGKLLGVRLTGSLKHRVELFGVEGEIRSGNGSPPTT